VAIAGRYRAIFEEMGATAIAVMDIRDRSQGEDPSWKTVLEQCTGVFITGGDQVRLCGLLADTPLVDGLRQRAQLGEITLAGTSAGAAVMGYHMIAGGGSGESPNRSLVDMAIGLGFVPGVVVDQHFHNRNRMARLISAVAMQPDRLGLASMKTPAPCLSGTAVSKSLVRGL
jgi:cyanophycinase